MLTWFDAEPARYWIFAWSAFALLSTAAIAPVIASIVSEEHERRCLRLLPPWLFVFSLTLCFVAFRWPVWFVNRELSVDESQLLAEAITLRHDSVFWRSVDGTTHGPMDVYPLLILPMLRLDLDYRGARILGAALVWLTLFASYRALAVFGREYFARLGILPAICFFAFTSYAEFVHYSSEHVPIALLAAGCWLIVSDVARPARRARSPRWIFAGLLLGAVPMAKLQGTPIAAALLIGATLLDFALPGPSRRDRLFRLLTLAGGTMAMTLFFLSVAGIFGVWRHAWISYVLQNLHYSGAGDRTFMEWTQNFWEFTQTADNFSSFATGLLLVGAFAVVPAVQARVASLRWTGFTLLLLLASLISTVIPRREFPHYLLLLIAPAAIFVACLWHAAWETFSGPRVRWSRAVLLFVFCAATIAPQISNRLRTPHPFLKQLASTADLPDDAVATEVLRYSRPGDRLGVWGWAPRYYVFTQLPQATRDAQTFLQLMDSPLIEYYRTRYMRDFTRHPPAVFIDDVGPGSFGFGHREDHAHETLSPLHDLIAQDYRQVAEIRSARIYVRLDRLSER